MNKCYVCRQLALLTLPTSSLVGSADVQTLPPVRTLPLKKRALIPRILEGEELYSCCDPWGYRRRDSKVGEMIAIKTITLRWAIYIRIDCTFTSWVYFIVQRN